MIEKAILTEIRDSGTESLSKTKFNSLIEENSKGELGITEKEVKLKKQKKNLIGECKVFTEVEVTNSTETWHFVHPVLYVLPQTLKGLINVIKFAEKKDLNIHPIGSKHSFSVIVQTDDCYVDLTDLNPYKAKKNKHEAENHNRDVKKINQDACGLLKSGVSTENHIDIPAAMRIWMINHILCPDNENDIHHFGDKRIFNMGGGDVQHFAGAMGSGTHGTGGVHSAYHDMVRSLIIVGSGGEAFRVEPKNGITDPAKHKQFYNNKTIKVKLFQDDDLFYSVLVSMGCFGIIHSCVLEITDMIHLYEEVNYSPTKRPSYSKRNKWNPNFKQIFSKSLLKKGDYFLTLMINPYRVRNKKYQSVLINKAVPKNNPPAKSKKVLKRQFWPSVFGKLKVTAKFTRWLTNRTDVAPVTLIETILRSQNDNSKSSGSGYYDLSYKIHNAGTGTLKTVGVAIEFAFPTSQIPEVLDLLFAFLKQTDTFKKGYYLNAPLALRFARPSKAYMANNYGKFKGKDVKEWCHIELLRVNPKSSAKDAKELELYQHIQLMFLHSGGRPHWGLNFKFPFSEDVLDDLYPKFDEWLAAFLFFNSSGVFDNEFVRNANIRSAAKRRHPVA